MTCLTHFLLLFGTFELLCCHFSWLVGWLVGGFVAAFADGLSVASCQVSSAGI